MKSLLREQAIKLRTENNLSYSAIKEKLGVAKSTLSYWLRGFPLTEDRIKELRNQSWEKNETSRERFRNAMAKKRENLYQEAYEKQKEKLKDLSKDSFFTAGLMLYLGEGDKKNRNRINLANTDPFIINFFIKWLNDFLDIPKEKIRAQVHLYENMNVKKEIKFWINEIGFKESQFYKPSIRKLQKSSFSYKESYRHGTCSLYICDTEKKRELAASIQALLDLYKETIIKGD